MRNGFSYFGMGDLLACQQAQRAVLLSGTPFDNSSGDLDTYLSEGWLGGGRTHQGHVLIRRLGS